MRKELSFEGNKITTLNEEIAIKLGEWEEGCDPRDIPNYKIGTYRGDSVYAINDVLYTIEDRSWTCNSEYHWYLKEVTDNCYKHFNRTRGEM